MVLIRLVVVAIIGCLLSGCGTMANLDGRRLALISMPDEERPQVLGGVQKDFDWIGSVYWPAKPIFILDLPVSLVADIITLPKVREEQIRWDKKKEENEVKPPSPTRDAASGSN